MGRQLQKEDGQSPQVCLMMPLLVGTDGVNKMSKSYDNYIGINETANDMYGKSLSIPDSMIYSYFELVTDVSNEELAMLKERVVSDPRNSKHDLALAITRLYYGEAAAYEARKYFEQTVINKEIPDEMPEFKFGAENPERLITIISSIKFAPSNGEARRLIQQGGVSIDGEVIGDVNHEITFKPGDAIVLKVGKRKFARLVSN